MSDNVPTPSTPSLRSPSAALAILFDQYDGSPGPGPAAQRLPDFGDAVLESADDFTVPGGETWSVTGVNAILQNAATGLVVDSFEVSIYADAAGLPGAPLCTYPNVTTFVDNLPADPNNFDLEIALSIPCVLAAGTYWVSVMADLDFALQGQLFWATNSTSGNGSTPAFRDPSNLASACTAWDLFANCPTGTIADLQFQIEGDLTSLPVELTRFEAISDEIAVTLVWETASETNNAGFEIQHGMGREGDFETIGFVEGHGTTDEARSYHFRVAEDEVGIGVQAFRLKQIDYDGAFEYSPVVEVSVDLPTAYTLEAAYPNPFNPSTTLGFAMAESAPVSIRLYDVTGKLRGTLYEGTPTANEMHQVTVDGAGLPSGSYIVRLEGSGFVDSELIVLMK